MSTDNKGLHGDGPALTPEKRAADIMLSVLGLNRSELADVYRSQTQDDPTQKLYELATIAASEYTSRGESIPAHVQSLLTSARQLNESGEQWSEQSRQDLCSTVLIAAAKAGLLGVWER